MSPRPRATFAKRQKEQARQQKQRDKAERKMQRKLENQAMAERGETAPQDHFAQQDMDLDPMPNNDNDTDAELTQMRPETQQQ